MDQDHDILNSSLIKLAENKIIFNIIKKAEIREEKGLDKLVSHQFAFPEARYFPIDTPENTLLSAAYFLEKSGSFSLKTKDLIQKNLVSAAILYNVEDQLLKLAEEILSESKSKELNDSDENYGLVVTIEGRTERKYPLKTEVNVKSAIEYFEKNYAKYPVSWRRYIAENIRSKAYFFNIEIPEESKIREYSGTGGCHIFKAAEYLNERVKYAPTLESATVYNNIAKNLANQPVGSTDLEKTAEFIRKFDELCGMQKFINRGCIKDAYQTIFNEPLIKKAETINLAGKEFSKDDLANTNKEIYSIAMGEDFIKQVVDDTGHLDTKKLIDVISTLPRPDQSILAEHIKKVRGVSDSNSQHSII